MQTRLRLVAVSLATAALVLSSCDYVVDVTIVNNTSQDLLTWGRYTACSDPIRWRDEFSGTTPIAPHSTFHASGVTGGDVQCAQVATTDRRLILSEPVALGATFTITEPVQPFGEPVPERDTLPRMRGWETFREDSLQERVYLLAGWLLGAGVVTGTSAFVVINRQGHKGAGRVVVLVGGVAGFALGWLASVIYLVNWRDELLSAVTASLGLAAVTFLVVWGRNGWRMKSRVDSTFPW